MNFRDYENNIIPIENILNLIDKQEDYKIYVGTDSQVKKKEKKVVYATCIVLYKIGKGGRIFTSRAKSKIPNSLKERLASEVWRSLEVALEISNTIKSANIIVHVDVNKSPKFKSGNHQQELVSMVVGQGFKCEIKPNSFAATAVADRYAKREDI